MHWCLKGQSFHIHLHQIPEELDNPKWRIPFKHYKSCNKSEIILLDRSFQLHGSSMTNMRWCLEGQSFHIHCNHIPEELDILNSVFHSNIIKIEMKLK